MNLQLFQSGNKKKVLFCVLPFYRKQNAAISADWRTELFSFQEINTKTAEAAAITTKSHIKRFDSQHDGRARAYYLHLNKTSIFVVLSFFKSEI